MTLLLFFYEPLLSFDSLHYHHHHRSRPEIRTELWTAHKAVSSRYHQFLSGQALAEAEMDGLRRLLVVWKGRTEEGTDFRGVQRVVVEVYPCFVEEVRSR